MKYSDHVDSFSALLIIIENVSDEAPLLIRLSSKRT
jgi:hypothetical protein